jgi:iron(III) transport system ATP-binding protein
MSSEYLLEAQNISCGYNRKTVINDLAFRMKQGEIASIIGPSGCGKTTLLHVIAGFQRLYTGHIYLNKQCVSSVADTVSPEKRKIGMVFQDYALFPHMTVAKNIRFGLPKNQKKSNLIVDEMLELTGLTSFTTAYPHELSGGQQQRVALARALAPEPLVLLMDEPFSNLDAELRARLSLDVRDILKYRNTAAILVTHDQNEAFAMADHVGILRDGILQQWDIPFNLYHEPANRFVARFIGRGVLLPGKLLAPDQVETELGTIRGNRAYSWPKNQQVEVLIRPDDVVFDADLNSPLRAKVADKIFAGSSTLYRLELASGRKIEILAPSHQDYEKNANVALRLAADHLIAFKKN